MELGNKINELMELTILGTGTCIPSLKRRTPA